MAVFSQVSNYNPLLNSCGPISADTVYMVSVICGLPQPEKKIGKLKK
jgi:hypothetical protein